MLKIITIIFALLGIFAAVSIVAWLKNRTVRNDVTADTYSTVRSRYSEFWSIQLLPLILMLAIIGAAIFFGVGRINAAVFLGGAVLCFVSVLAGSGAVVSGSIASSSLAVSGDVRRSLKAAYRSASVMGLCVSATALLGLGVMFFFLDTGQLISFAACFGLGASLTSLITGLSGTAFSGAYALTVRSDDFTDYTGMFAGCGADFAETYILSACAAALLAEVGVDTSGVMSTFTAASAARYPLIVFAAGIVASIIGIFVYRARIVKNPAAGVTAGSIAAGLIIAAAAVYFSMDVLQSYIYAFCVIAGIVAVLLSGEIIKFYSSDGYIFRRHVPDAKKVGAIQSIIYSLSVGMISVVIPSVFTLAAMIVSYNFANFYGIGLAAIGISSMTAVNSSVRGFSINAASASDIASVVDPDAQSPSPADVLLTASARTDVIGKTYSAIATSVTLVALFTSISVTAKNQSVNLLSTPVFVGMTLGAVSIFVCAGLIIRAVRLTSYILRDTDDADEKRITGLRGLVPLYLIAAAVPVAAGLAGGVNGLVSFACSVSITGMCLIYSFNNSGRYFDRMAIESLGTVIKFMVALTLVCAPVFINFGGIL